MEKYFNKSYTQYVSIIAAFITPIFLIMTFVLRFMKFVIYNLSFLFGFFINIISILQNLITVVAFGICIVSILLCVHEITRDKEKNMYFAAISASMISILSLMAYFYDNRFTTIFIFSIFLGIEMIIKVFLTPEGFSSDIDLKNDSQKALMFYQNYKLEKQCQVNRSADSKEPISTTIIQPSINQNNFNSNLSFFDGTGFEIIGYYILLWVISVLTLGIGVPWILTIIVKWRVTHTVIDGKRLDFNGSGHQLFGLWIKWWLLSLITCGIYLFFATVDYNKWELKHTYYANEFNPNNTSYFDGNSFEYIGYSILTNIIGSITCLIAIPWCRVTMEKWFAQHNVISGHRLIFDGTGLQFFGKFLFLLLLTIITCGLYFPWAIVSYNKWITQHTHIDHRWIA